MDEPIKILEKLRARYIKIRVEPENSRAVTQVWEYIEKAKDALENIRTTSSLEWNKYYHLLNTFKAIHFEDEALIESFKNSNENRETIDAVVSELNVVLDTAPHLVILYSSVDLLCKLQRLENSWKYIEKIRIYVQKFMNQDTTIDLKRILMVTYAAVDHDLIDIDELKEMIRNTFNHHMTNAVNYTYGLQQKISLFSLYGLMILKIWNVEDEDDTFENLLQDDIFPKMCTLVAKMNEVFAEFIEENYVIENLEMQHLLRDMIYMTVCLKKATNENDSKEIVALYNNTMAKFVEWMLYEHKGELKSEFEY